MRVHVLRTKFSSICILPNEQKKKNLKSYQERNRVVIGIWKKIHLHLEIKCITSSFLHMTIDM